MAAKRAIDRLSSFPRVPVPPPSPIPTGKGSRSAVDPAVSEIIEKSKQVPELILPEHPHRLVPDEIEYGLLRVRDDDAVNRLVRSATELGGVRIIGHGISSEELRSAMVENDAIFGLSTTHLVWPPSDKSMIESVKEILGDVHFQNFSQKLDNAARELEAIAKELAEIICPSGDKQAQRHIQSSVSTLILHAYNQIPPPLDLESHKDSSIYALNLNLLLEPGEFSAQFERGRMSFTTSPDTIVVTLGKQLEEWSLGEFKSTQGELILKPNLHEHQAAFSIELKWSFPSLKNSLLMEAKKRISITDQLFILIFAVVLFNLFALLYS